MCGISGTLYNKDYINGPKVNVDELLQYFNNDNYHHKISKILDLSWKYKSNINFLKYCKDKCEREKVKNLCNIVDKIILSYKDKIPKINKTQSLNEYNKIIKDYTNLQDIKWFFNNEIRRLIDTIEYISDSKISNLENEQIVLYKEISKVIHAIDLRLETRGRDSLGLSIVLSSKDFLNKDKLFLEKNNPNVFENYFFNNEVGSYTFVFKTFDSIGSLGDNAKIIKNLIKCNSNLKKLVYSKKVETATIVAHTRWASVGVVSLENCHPLDYIHHGSTNHQSLSSLNGDIHNYREIINSRQKKNKIQKDPNIFTSDCLAIPCFLEDNQNINRELFLDMASELDGSYVIALQHTRIPDQINLIKKGIQGLYVGFSYDGIMFSSDVYGLIESCKYFVPIDYDCTINISGVNNPTFDNPEIEIFEQKNLKKITLSSKLIKTTNITTRDIDRIDHEHFLEKEIYDTPDIIRRTINRYLQPYNSINNENIREFVSIKPDQVPPFILKSIREHKIKKIIITGMGTCYTAAVAISMYMRARLKMFMPDLLVEPHIATEGSGFYLKPNMSDTLVIVVAQSGTTVDTNVYVQMAKDRGAMTLAIANKREGDVTFIVDGTLYIGEGRDIEIAVPSTKTYTAQVILGYILSIFFSSQIAKNEEHINILKNDIINLKSSEILIKDSISKIENDADLKHISDSASKYNSWYVIRCDTTNSVCADEIRIKYSENCYESVPSFSIDEAISINIKNSFLTIIIEENYFDIKNALIKLLINDNKIILICNQKIDDSDIKLFEERKKIKIIEMPKSKKYFSFIPTIIAGQFLSYYLAKGLDRRKDFFIEILKNIHCLDNLLVSYNKLVNLNKSGFLNQSYRFQDLNYLRDLMEKLVSKDNYKNEKIKKNLTDHLEKLIQYSRRTIDTIKHQAKTITVGAVRNDNDTEYLYKYREKISLSKESEKEKNISNLVLDTLPSLKKNNSQLNLDNNSEILIIYDGENESLAYNILNFLSNIFIKLEISKEVRIARSYDVREISESSKEFFIFIIEDHENLEFLVNKNLRAEQYIVYCFNEWNNSLKSNFINSFTKNINIINYKKSLWSLIISISFISNHLLQKEKYIKSKSYVINHINHEIERNLNSLMEISNEIIFDQRVNSEIDYAIKVFISRTNWKSLGSGVNYNISKFTSRRIAKSLSIACAADVLENHKHIDISAESAIITFIANIQRKGYQMDVYSELEKIVSHNNAPILITNLDDFRFDNMNIQSEDENQRKQKRGIPIIKIPKINEQYSFTINVLLVEIFIAKTKDYLNKNGIKLINRNENNSLEVT